MFYVKIKIKSTFHLIYIWFLLYLISICFGYPVKKSSPGLSVPPPEILKFMRRFGYLDSRSSDSEALYHETAIIAAVKNIQKFGALNQTGILDDSTLKLLVSPRCGVADIEPQSTRAKRFVVGAKKWQKRNIKYFIANWSNKVGETKVVEAMADAFSIWSKYSNLRFKRVYDPSADIIVAFGSGDHGDHYPFDGPGNILAHAFYPYEMQSFGGDVHFDEDEHWKENSTSLENGVDFFSVAVHELGHSLGLAHSPIYSSIMFPYYKGPGRNELDFDDILAMYELYIKYPIENQDEEDDEEFEESGEELTSTTPRVRATTSTQATVVTEYPSTTFEGDYDTVDSHKHKNGDITTVQPKTRMTTISSTKSHIPNICEGHFDSVSVFRGELFIFKGEYIWRLTDKYRIMSGYPIRLRDMFHFLPPDVKRITASYERPSDDAIIIFTGNRYWVYDGNNLLGNSSRPITDLGINEDVEIDAAMFWPKNDRTYFFAKQKFWRYNEDIKRIDDGYPMNMSRWYGLPPSIDAATTTPNGKTYFFKDNLYWLYNNKWVRPEGGYPRRASNAWLGCPLTQKRRRLRNNT